MVNTVSVGIGCRGGATASACIRQYGQCEEEAAFLPVSRSASLAVLSPKALQISIQNEPPRSCDHACDAAENVGASTISSTAKMAVHAVIVLRMDGLERPDVCFPIVRM